MVLSPPEKAGRTMIRKSRSGPLAGVGVVVTRPRKQASGFADRLRASGADVLVCPTIRIVPPASYARLDRAIERLERYDWLIFTSVNAVEPFAARARKVRGRAPFPRNLKTCAIGPATAEAMRAKGIPVVKISAEYVAESILKALPKVRGLKILIPRAAVAREILPVELARRGAEVDLIPAYRTVPDRSSLPKLKAWIRAGRVRCVAFTSSSTVKNFAALTGRTALKKLRSAGAVSASIGPVTTKTLRGLGWPPRIVAEKPTTGHLARAVSFWYTRTRKDSHGT
jgi:uroporphyrinogen III methyltransferase/synthase